MQSWQQALRYNPLPPLLSSDNQAIDYFVRRDLIGEDVGPSSALWGLPALNKLFRKQQEDGSWKYPGGKEHLRSKQQYDQLETYRVLGFLVEKFGLTDEHPALHKAADFLFSFQTAEGDFRGIYSTQYSPNYSAAIMELLIKAGYAEDPRIARGFEWLLSIRQDDGGWVAPMRTHKIKYEQAAKLAEPVQPDRTKPFSHLITGVVLRAFAAHPERRHDAEARRASELLKGRFFKADKYPDRRTPDFWKKLRYPFWFTDILSALDSLSLMGYAAEDVDIEVGLDWLIANQDERGLWKAVLVKAGDEDIDLWVSLAVCRVFSRLTQLARSNSSL
jgi:hypothetical protein